MPGTSNFLPQKSLGGSSTGSQPQESKYPKPSAEKAGSDLGSSQKSAFTNNLTNENLQKKPPQTT